MLVIATGLNYLGVRVAVRGVLALSAISLIPFLILAITIIAKGGDAGNTLSVFGTCHSSINSVFHGILFAVTLFIGFEAAASIGEEAREPHKAIPIALIGSVALAGVFYLLVTYAAAIGFGVHGRVVDLAGSRLADGYARAAVRRQLAVDARSTWSYCSTRSRSRSRSRSPAPACSSRSARDGLLPRFVGRTSAHKTPLGGNLDDPRGGHRRADRRRRHASSATSSASPTTSRRSRSARRSARS